MGSRVDLLCMFIFLFAWVVNVSSISGIFNVMDYGAVADAKTDNAKAFMRAWKEACAWNGKGSIVIPEGAYLAGPVTFVGPCKGGGIVFLLKGVVKAPVDDLTSDSWITFDYINGLMMSGGGTFDGQGALAWSHNRCSKEGVRCKLPISIRFNFVTDSIIRDISSINSKFFHINILGSKNLELNSLKISAPRNSPNTDGIHIGRSTGVKIFRTMIGTGDDCISLGPGSNDISISQVFCGPGHGISVGSLGKSKKEEAVFGVTVKNCALKGTENGLRIKTWPDSSIGIASNFTFEDVTMNNVRNPIIIDQEYCPYDSCKRKPPSRIKISNVSFKNIKGTSASKLAINLSCSKGVPCEGVKLSDINLKYIGKDGPATSACSNVKAIVSGKLVPPTCI